LESGNRQSLSHGNTAMLGSKAQKKLSDEEKAELADRMRMFELLEPNQNTMLDLSSDPEGADVFIDSVGFCKTPCSALVRSGDREVELLLEGESKVHELVDMAVGSRVSRIFKLVSDKGSDAAGDSENAAAGKPYPAAHGLRPDQSAKALLFGAQAARTARDFEKAASLYKKLIETYPSSNEATISLVSLGEIKLEKLNDPNTALELFNRYLRGRGKGALAPEALFGKSLAERALGRIEKEQETLELILKRFPSAVQTAEASKRLAEIEGDFEHN
jgi:TolA-binding protein